MYRLPTELCYSCCQLCLGKEACRKTGWMILWHLSACALHLTGHFDSTPSLAVPSAGTSWRLQPDDSVSETLPSFRQLPVWYSFLFSSHSIALPTPRCFWRVLTPTVWQEVSGRVPNGSCISQAGVDGSIVWAGGRCLLPWPQCSYFKRFLTLVPWKGSEMTVWESPNFCSLC